MHSDLELGYGTVLKTSYLFINFLEFFSCEVRFDYRGEFKVLKCLSKRNRARVWSKIWCGILG